MHRIDIAIIGGGAAGIAAARVLAGRGCSALLVEASDRLGGRAQTILCEGHALDLGCGWLHSARRNAWARIAAASGVPVEHTRPLWRRQYRDLGFSPAERDAADAAMAAFHDRLRDAPPPSDRASDALPPDGASNAYLEAISGFLNGAALNQVSIADYRAYDDASTEDNWRLPDGYGALVAGAMPGGIEARLSTPVTRIAHGGKRIMLDTPAGTIEAGAAIVTVPTSVLARGALTFDPPLPDKRDAAEALPLGLADKIFLTLDDEGIEADAHLAGDPRRADAGSHILRPFGRPLVECFYGGTGAQALAVMGDAAAADVAIGELVALLGSAMRPKLRFLTRSSWCEAAWIGGSYSHALPGRQSARRTLAEPVGDRLFFAGEACSAADFGTAHGAHDSGVAAAALALRAIAGRR